MHKTPATISFSNGHNNSSTFAFPSPFLNPVFISPSSTSTSLPRISLVGVSAPKSPYRTAPSAVLNRINRSNVAMVQRGDGVVWAVLALVKEEEEGEEEEKE
ncbi:hypothetical protein IAQ61_001982 [Plenodomus lingam]|uniref:uncharacterized protein n=1 Tax=Leptosphaeria maculans TaxID=5022 RepID=UPI00331C3039|nr:hypothetical protein IAQ61_001982 [Plenodomus lingam]